MCWTTATHDLMKEQIAFEDMVVYKMLSIRKGKFGRTKFISPYMNFRYKPGKVYHAKLVITQTPHFLTIDEGLHCFQNLASAGRYADSYGDLCIIVPAIIPGGTKYYINERGEIITEKLKIVL